MTGVAPPGAGVPGLLARGSTTVGGEHIAVDLAAAPGEVVGLLGPNGAGKTTVLRTLAGLSRLSSGRITLDGGVLDDPDAGVLVPPARRRVGLVFQELRLFPHLSVVEDVAFGLRARGVPARAARATAEGWLERVGLANRARARFGELSGGQAQLVALARALAPDPALLLLDEPMAALDVTTRAEVRQTLRAHLEGFAGPAVVVTHDAIDALTLADRLVVVERGAVVQDGPPAEVVQRPASPWIADLVGLVLVTGTLRAGGAVRLEGGHVLRTAPVRDGHPGPGPGDPVHVAVRPSAVALHRSPPEGSPRNVWRANVTGVEASADRVRVQTDGPVAVTAEITHAALSDMALVPGDTVWVSIKATELDVYPR